LRVLNVICGLAVMLVSLHLVHAIHHFVSRPPRDVSGATIWMGAALAAVIGVFSFVGGCLLIRRSG